MKKQSNDTKRYLTVAQLRERYGGVSHMWIQRRLQKDPNFPKPVKLGGSALRMFDLIEVEEFEKKCVRDAQ
jgi:predicted DNA-binding transcriptional regulator AlpA